tara:strand:+ start:16262 stop:18241 length:1980 start_codon:yes stop_codon:yes gene_type:complete
MMNILIFAGDMADTAQQRRIASLHRLGHHPRIVSFRKSAIPLDPSVDHLDLGEIHQGRLGRRALQILRSLPRIVTFVRAKPAVDVTLARNLDMVYLAMVCLWISRRKSPVVYECLDIHGIFMRGGIKQRLSRWAERMALRRIAHLVVSAPAFITQYFAPLQGYTGDWRVLENKLWFDETPSRPTPTPRDANLNIRLGWVGNIRCQASMDMLMAVADQRDNVEIHIHGRVHDHALIDFHDRVAQRENVTYHGPYEYPDGLKSTYAECDLVWAQDLWQTGANSDWLLPNRIYEAAWHGCPSVAIRGTATGDKITRDGLGYAVGQPKAQAVVDLLDMLTPIKLMQKRCEILAKPNHICVQSHQDVANAIVLKSCNLPDFIGIGAMRAGTTTLYNYCAGHPDIGVSKIKETDFFIQQKNWYRGLQWYKSLFSDQAKIRGEFSPNYTKGSVFDDVPERIHAHLPQVKLIYIVRNPVDRAVSQYTHSFLSGAQLPDLQSLIGSHEWRHLIDTSSYAKQLRKFYALFPPEQILILNLETLKNDPQKVLSQLAAFLGVGNNWNTDATMRENTSNSLARLSPRALRMANSEGGAWIKPYLPTRAKQWIKRVMRRRVPRNPPVFDADLKMEFWHALRDDMTAFEQMTGIAFTPPVTEKSQPISILKRSA